MLADISERCDTIEECYEFMLAYAAQGLPSDEGSRSGGQIREYLGRAACLTATHTTRSPRLSWFSHNPPSALN